MPLWAGYLVKGYAWRAILDPGGRCPARRCSDTRRDSAIEGTTITLSYLWLPYMIIPIYAGLDRLPNSLLEASTDLGAKAGRTFRKVVLPQLWPSIIAGSIFTFALTLGDFYMNRIVGGTTAVHRQRRLPRVQCEPSVRRGVLDAADRDHDRLPARRRARTGALEEL